MLRTNLDLLRIRSRLCSRNMKEAPRSTRRNHVSLYPNPTADQMQISADRILRVEVFNLAGQKMMDNEYSDSHVVLDASHLTAGTYMVTVTTNTGKTTKKVIVR